MNAVHLNPDHYLQTASGRLYTAERNAAAWEQLYADLSAALEERARHVVMVIGVQGAGKSTWTKKHLADPGDAIYVDWTFATAARRARVVEIAAAAGVPVSVVWIRVSLETALRRNTERPADQIVPHAALRNVFAIFEPPSLSEGFQEVVVIDDEPAPAA